MSADADNQYFSDGLAEELINALMDLPGLHVASRTSSFRFRGRDADIEEIGTQLHVAAVLEGSVRRAGSRLRVTAQLTSIADGYHLWSERYDREMADVFAIQDDIVAAIVKAIAPALAGVAQTAVKRPTENVEAYELYLKGATSGISGRRRPFSWPPGCSSRSSRSIQTTPWRMPGWPTAIRSTRCSAGSSADKAQRPARRRSRAPWRSTPGSRRFTPRRRSTPCTSNSTGAQQSII